MYNSTPNDRDYASTTSKNGKITDILDDYEKTKTFNEGLLKNIGSPKGPVFARNNNIKSKGNNKYYSGGNNKNDNVE